MTTVVNHLIYDAFGRVTSESNPAVDSLFLFTGRPFDSDTGPQNNLNRWYDPAVGRWLSEDPIGFAAGDGNLYRYVGNRVSVASDAWGTDHMGFVFPSPRSVRKVSFADSERCLQNGVTRDDMRKIALAAVEACDRIARVIILLDRYLPELQSLYPDTGMIPSVGKIVNGPAGRLKVFRENLGRCAEKCKNGPIEFRCTKGGHCEKARDREVAFYTMMSPWTYKATTEMLVCVDNQPTVGLPGTVWHELGRWCGRQYVNGDNPPQYSIRYWDWVIGILGEESTVQYIISRRKAR